MFLLEMLENDLDMMSDLWKNNCNINTENFENRKLIRLNNGPEFGITSKEVRRQLNFSQLTGRLEAQINPFEWILHNAPFSEASCFSCKVSSTFNLTCSLTRRHCQSMMSQRFICNCYVFITVTPFVQ